jgi:phage shock protein A
MANSIGDAETAKVAAEYAERHERRHSVLVEKLTALEKELELRRVEADEMVEKIKVAEKERDALAASVGRTQARQSVRDGDPLFDELDRMADLMRGGKRPANPDDSDDVLADLDSEVDARLFDEQVKPRDTDVDARLAELKRRMNDG